MHRPACTIHNVAESSRLHLGSMTPTSQKRRWTSRIGTIIRRTSKSQRLSHSISFDQDAEFVPRICDVNGNLRTLPHVTLDIQPVLSTLCTIAESPLREAEATQSAAAPWLGGPVYGVNTLSSEYSTSQAAVTELDLPKPAPPPIPQISVIATPTDSDQDLIYNNTQARDAPQLDFTEHPSEDECQAQVPRSESTDEISTASFYEMTHCNSICHTPSNSTTSMCQLPLDLRLGHVETCFPLSMPHDTIETPVSTDSSDDHVISWFPYSASSDKLERLHTMGWLEYHFPNGNFYYFHPDRKISTEVDLTNDTLLDIVEEFLEEYAMDASNWSGLRGSSDLGMTLNGHIEHEIWLKDIGLSNEGSEGSKMFEIWWVDHVARTMVWTGQEINKGGASTVQKDQIDMEYRYWAFIQSHPAHTVLPPNAKSAAINTLAWAWTDHLLSSCHSDSVPFTREECRDSITLLKSLIVEKHHHQVIQTCIIAGVFLQVAQWHKSHRCDKGSLADISISIIESSDPPKPKKSWFIRYIFPGLVIFILIVLFTLLYGMGQNGIVFAQVQVIVDKIITIASLKHASPTPPEVWPA